MNSAWLIEGSTLLNATNQFKYNVSIFQYNIYWLALDGEMRSRRGIDGRDEIYKGRDEINKGDETEFGMHGVLLDLKFI